MKTFKQLFGESTNDAERALSAQKNFERIHAATKTIGSRSGGARVIEDHHGGVLHRTTVADTNYHSYSAGAKNGHHFAERYQYGSRPDQVRYSHVHFPKHTDFTDHDHIRSEVERQNPHHPGSHTLAHTIIQRFGHLDEIR